MQKLGNTDIVWGWRHVLPSLENWKCEMFKGLLIATVVGLGSGVIWNPVWRHKALSSKY